MIGPANAKWRSVMPEIARLERDIARVENNLAQLQIRKQLAELDRKLIVLTAMRRVYSPQDSSPPQTT
jgi:hypothetical protein